MKGIHREWSWLGLEFYSFIFVRIVTEKCGRIRSLLRIREQACWLHHRGPIRSSIASTRTRILARMGRSGIVGVGVVDEVVEGEMVVGVGNEEQGWILTAEA